MTTMNQSFTTDLLNQRTMSKENTIKTPEQLHIKSGARIFKIRSYVDHRDQPIVTAECLEVWDHYDDDESSHLYEDTRDNQWATFYLRPDDIDIVIEKLKEVKQFMTNPKNDGE